MSCGLCSDPGSSPGVIVTGRCHERVTGAVQTTTIVAKAANVAPWPGRAPRGVCEKALGLGLRKATPNPAYVAVSEHHNIYSRWCTFRNLGTWGDFSGEGYNCSLRSLYKWATEAEAPATALTPAPSAAFPSFWGSVPSVKGATAS